ncbi:hypothetical protein [Paraburkholderia diazotrophica]|uniref:PIN-like domain-containing protein n=1 Tax=Paraburkholderia diazotrophica TaxID=667676 RepID=UPI0031719174
MRFFVDNNFPPPLAKALHALCEPWCHETWHLKQRFVQNAVDSYRIESLSKEGGWAVIAHDKLNKGLEREALRRAGLVVFFLDKGWSHHAFWDKAHNLVRWWPRIIEQSAGIKGGAAFKVPYNFSGKGQFEQVTL